MCVFVWLFVCFNLKLQMKSKRKQIQVWFYVFTNHFKYAWKTSQLCCMTWMWQNNLIMHFNVIFGMCGNDLPNQESEFLSGVCETSFTCSYDLFRSSWPPGMSCFIYCFFLLICLALLDILLVVSCRVCRDCTNESLMIKLIIYGCCEPLSVVFFIISCDFLHCWM